MARPGLCLRLLFVTRSILFAICDDKSPEAAAAAGHRSVIGYIANMRAAHFD